MVKMYRLVVIVILSSAAAQRSANNTYPTQELSLNSLMPLLMGNTTDNTTFFHAITDQLYYNSTTELKPVHEITRHFNLTGLTPEEISIVLAFPSFPDTATLPPKVTTAPSVDNYINTTLSANQTDIEDQSPTIRFRRLVLPMLTSHPNDRSFNRLQRMRPLFRPQVINNYFIQRQGSRTEYVKVGAEKTNDTVDRVRAAIFVDSEPDLKNVHFGDIRPVYPSFPMVASKVSQTKPTSKPDYPSDDIEPPVLDVFFN